MNILIVDTSYNKLVVALKSRDRVAFRIIDCGMKKNNSLVLPTIDDVLDELNVGITDVGCFACVVGPGSFTGVRIGVATMNAFNDVFKKKLVSINALEILAYNIKGGSIMTSIDARHGNLYSAVFDEDYTHIRSLLCNTVADFDAFDGKKVMQDSEKYDIDALIGVAEHKVNFGQFVETLKPLYMKDSQAEREYMEKHNA